MKEINDDELQFVVRHYEEGALDTDRAWKRFRLRTHAPAREGGEVHQFSPLRNDRGWLSFRRIAASVSIAFIVGASVASGLWYVRQQTTADEASTTTTPATTIPYRYLQPQAESIVLKYDNAPLDDVLDELSSYYGRTITWHADYSTNSADSPQNETAPRHISGEIEATSLEEVIEILEATLDVEIEIQ